MTAPTEAHTPEAHDVIACELTACILGQRAEFEAVGVGAYVGQRMLDALKPLTRAMAKAVAEIEP